MKSSCGVWRHEGVVLARPCCGDLGHHVLARSQRLQTTISWCLSGVVSLAFGGASALAQTPPNPPLIQIVSPTPGSGSDPAPPYNTEPVITVLYSGERPLVLDSLSVLVNGNDWTGKFEKTLVTAAYAVTGDDALVAGPLLITASISDDAGGQASASAAFTVYPSLNAALPDAGVLEDEVTIGAQGLDPNPANNSVLFAASYNKLRAPFVSVERATRSGRVKIPLGATTGAIGLEVNGLKAREQLPFAVTTVVPRCGRIAGLRALADGGWIASYYSASFADPLCPVESSFPVAIRVQHDGTAGPLAACEYYCGDGPVVAVDKAGANPGELAYIGVILPWRVASASGPRLPAEVRYKGVRTTLGDLLVNSADFGPDGALYFTGWIPPMGYYSLWRVPKAALEAGGSASPEQIVVLEENLLGEYWWQFPNSLVVGCDGQVYVGFNDEREDPGAYIRPHILKIDPKTGAVSAEWTGTYQGQSGDRLSSLALTCHDDQLWGVTLLDGGPLGASLWRADTAAGLGAPEEVVNVPYPIFPGIIAPGPEGHLYFATGSSAILVAKNAVEPCEDSPMCLPLCQALKILPETTRWKPQRDTEKNIEVFFKGPNDLDLASVKLEATSPGLVGYEATVGEQRQKVEDLDATTAKYQVTWTGPWTYGDSEPLPRGDYSVVVRAKRLNSEVELASGPSRVSLVEVVEVSLHAWDGSVLDSNPGVPDVGGNIVGGTGMRIFAEARSPGAASVRDKVLVTAIIDPPVEARSGQPPVSIFFRTFDVDDPSASGLPIDDETLSEDNCPARDCGVPPAGLLNGVDGQQPVSVALPAGGAEAWAVLQVSTRQGDNYRVAASTAGSWLKALSPLQGTPPAGAPDAWVGAGAIPLPPASPEARQVSPLLTVWRTLHLETDYLDTTMASAGFLDLKGQSTDLTPQRLTDTLLRPFVGRDEPCDHCRNNGWAGGILWPRDIPNLTTFTVFGNRRDYVTVSPLDDMTRVAATGDTYRLADDEWVDLSVPLPLGFLGRCLRRAYVETVPLGQENGAPAQPFNEATRHLELATQMKMGANRDVRSSPGFWSALLISAYDARSDYDGDPRLPGMNQGELYVLGTTLPSRKPGAPSEPTQPVAAVFSETIRDQRDTLGCASRFREMLEATTAHEILAHALDLGSTGQTLTNEFSGTAVCAGLPTVWILNDHQVAFLRRLPAPLVNGGNPRNF